MGGLHGVKRGGWGWAGRLINTAEKTIAKSINNQARPARLSPNKMKGGNEKKKKRQRHLISARALSPQPASVIYRRRNTRGRWRSKEMGRYTHSQREKKRRPLVQIRSVGWITSSSLLGIKERAKEKKERSQIELAGSADRVRPIHTLCAKHTLFPQCLCLQMQDPGRMRGWKKGEQDGRRQWEIV